MRHTLVVLMALACLTPAVASRKSKMPPQCQEDKDDGRTWKEGDFQMMCTVTKEGRNTAYKADIKACLTPTGAEIAMNSELKEDGCVYHCTRLPDGRVESGHDACRPAPPPKPTERRCHGHLKKIVINIAEGELFEMPPPNWKRIAYECVFVNGKPTFKRRRL